MSDTKTPRQFLDELKAEAKMRGYKIGWAAIKFKQHMGRWPTNAENGVVSYQRLGGCSWVPTGHYDSDGEPEYEDPTGDGDPLDFGSS